MVGEFGVVGVPEHLPGIFVQQILQGHEYSRTIEKRTVRT
jgi:hypothetical protein